MYLQIDYVYWYNSATAGLLTGIFSPAENYNLDCLSALDLDNHLLFNPNVIVKRYSLDKYRV